MMYKCVIYFFICVISTKVCMCDRRITNGKVVSNPKKYMVYLLNSKYSSNQPEAWLCGGVIISRIHILTAAACLTEVSHIYVIAGYKKYVSGENIDKDECTRTKRKRIVKVIIPKAFNGSTWMQYDVGLGVVESRFSFLDVSYRRVCSYEPESILINFDLKKERTRSSALALGWGAADASKPGIVADRNSEYLMRARTIITNLTYCQEQFPKDIEYLFLCTDDHIDFKNGKAVPFPITDTELSLSTTNSPSMQGQYFKEMWRCLGKNFSSNATSNECLDLESAESSLRRSVLASNDTSDEIDENKTFDGNEPNINETIFRKRRQKFGTQGKNFGKQGKIFGGICQNDHGGPLVLPEGSKETVIGVALNSVYDKKYQCKGPFLFLSTARAGKLIKCLLSKKLRMKNRKLCSKNYEVTEYNVSWPTSSREQEGGKSCENGMCKIPEEPEPLNESEEPIRPTFTKGKYKRPNFNSNIKLLFTRPNINMGVFKRPTLNLGW